MTCLRLFSPSVDIKPFRAGLQTISWSIIRFFLWRSDGEMAAAPTLIPNREANKTSVLDCFSFRTAEFRQRWEPVCGHLKLLFAPLKPGVCSCGSARLSSAVNGFGGSCLRWTYRAFLLLYEQDLDAANPGRPLGSFFFFLLEPDWTGGLFLEIS